MRRKIVTIVAVAVAIAAALDNIRTKREAAALLAAELEAKVICVNGVPIVEKPRDETIEKLITRIGLLQKCLSEHGLLGEQPVVDDGLRLAGVYPQLIYGDPPGQQFGGENQAVTKCQ